VKEDGSGKIRLTQLVTDIIFPINNSDIEAKRKAFFNVPLFKDLYEAYGDQPTIDQIKWFLRQKGNAEPAKAGDKAPEIRKIYIESSKEIPTVEEREKPVETDLAPNRGVAMERIQSQPAMGEDVLCRLVLRGAGYIDVKDKRTYKLVEMYLKEIAKELGVEEEKE